MATKTLTITEEAYERLAGIKTGSESFSDVVNRLAGGHSFLELVGLLNREAADELKKNIAEMRKEWVKQVDKRAKVFS